MLPSHKTKIVCTIGPASEVPVIMERMLRAGMNVARLNFSHGELAGHREIIRNLRAAARNVGRRLAIMADLPGPKMRIGILAEEPVELQPEDAIVLSREEFVGSAARVSVSFTRLPEVVKPGDILFLNDGLIQLEVKAVRGSEVECVVQVGGELRSRKGLNLPGIDLGISAFTDRDHELLAFAAREGIDAISQSFVESRADIDAVREAAAALDYHPFLIAKIERANALRHLDGILDAADGIMIARGDLGVEVPIEKIAPIQKDIMRRANQRARPVITATQMLESMTANPRPTRAESTDVANAVLDGTDCVMLSGESAMGRYPVDAVEMLARIAAAAEAVRHPFTVSELYAGIELKGRLRPENLVALGVEAAIGYSDPAAIFTPTLSGATARRLSVFRNPVWIVAVSAREETCQGLAFSSGVHPEYVESEPEDWNAFVRRWVLDHGLEGDIALLTEGPSLRHPDANNRMEIVSLAPVLGLEQNGDSDSGVVRRPWAK